MRFSAVAGSLALCLAVAGFSAPPPAAAAAAAKDAEEYDYTQLGKFDDAINAKRFADALKVAEALPTPRDKPRIAALTLAMRASALLRLDRDAEAQRLIDQVVALPPTAHWPDHTIMWAGIDTENYPIALAALDRMIAAHPDKVRAMSNDIVSFVVNKGPKEDKLADDNRRLALARIHFGEQPYPDAYAFPAMRVLVDRGDLAGARELLPSIYSVESLQLMLIMRRYEKLWPTLAARVGKHLETARAADVERTRLLLVDNPEDAQRLSAYVSALVAAGDLRRAIELRSTLPTSREGMASITEDQAWIINNIAYAMHRDGQPEEADALLALLNQTAKPDGGWRINMLINRLELLIRDGKFAKADSLIEETDRIAQTEGSDYARQLIRGMRFCLNSRLDKTALAASARTAMLATAEDAKISSLSALMCANDFDGAEVLARKFSDDHNFKNDLAEALQARPLHNSDPSVWEKNWPILRDRPYFQKTFADLGRDLPDDLYFTVGKALPK